MLKVATLFSGIGTPEQSLKYLNIEHETVFTCEIDKCARTTYLANNQAPNTFYDDVYNIDGNKYKNQIDILIGGSPCQSFSIVGKRMGTSCPRGNLIYEYFRIVEESQPKVFIYENVKGFLSIDKGETFKNFVQSFKDLGYTTYHQVLNTKDYLIPQNRERIYIVGFKDNVDFHFQEKQELKLRLKDMLKDEVDEKYLLSEKAIKYITDAIRLKKKFTSLNGETAQTIMAQYSKSMAGTFLCVDSNGRIDTETVGTITSRYYKGNEKYGGNPFVYNLEKFIFRKLTPRECFRLQGFNDSFVFPPKMSDTQLYKQAGNGMSRNILDMIFAQIFTCYAKHIENIKE